MGLRLRQHLTDFCCNSTRQSGGINLSRYSCPILTSVTATIGRINVI
jgi:hypothetical protein